MASPLKTGKQSVKLGAPVRVSRIRRDPPGRVPEKTERMDPAEREIWTVVIGVIAFALAFAIIIIAVSDYTK